MGESQRKGKTMEEWIRSYPQLKEAMDYKPIYWKNPQKKTWDVDSRPMEFTKIDMEEAEWRWHKFKPLLMELFPETKEQNGLIESPLKEVPIFKEWIEGYWNQKIPGRFFVKCDNELPVAGSIKARGGIYEVLKHAESLAIKNGLLKREDDYSVMASEKLKDFYKNYSIAVGSTGNLGLSIGIIGASLGFKVTVHMSADAKEWKKKLLREKGVKVVEYSSDYSKAVETGRKESFEDPRSYFVDDEQSRELFLGYSVAAYRLKEQLGQNNIVVDEKRPLIVYLPCGVGGAPGGITFGLKQIFGNNVYCIFAEPTHSPCMLIGLMTGEHENICVQDLRIDNYTEADGLAVGCPSGLVCRTVGNWIDGIFTVEDHELYPVLTMLQDTHHIKIEPSAAAGFLGPYRMHSELSRSGQLFTPTATHIFWATGGLFVPHDLMDGFYKKGKELME